MESAEYSMGRRIGVVLEPGDDVLGSIVEACTRHGIRQGTIPLFLGAFRSMTFIASHSPIDDPEPPLRDSVEVAYVEGVGSGSIVWDAATDAPRVHLHASVGAKDEAALAYAGHVLAATTHYVAELVIEEITAPQLGLAPDPNAFGLPRIRLA